MCCTDLKVTKIQTIVLLVFVAIQLCFFIHSINNNILLIFFHTNHPRQLFTAQPGADSRRAAVGAPWVAHRRGESPHQGGPRRGLDAGHSRHDHL